MVVDRPCPAVRETCRGRAFQGSQRVLEKVRVVDIVLVREEDELVACVPQRGIPITSDAERLGVYVDRNAVTANATGDTRGAIIRGVVDQDKLEILSSLCEE